MGDTRTVAIGCPFRYEFYEYTCVVSWLQPFDLLCVVGRSGSRRRRTGPNRPVELFDRDDESRRLTSGTDESLVAAEVGDADRRAELRCQQPGNVAGVHRERQRFVAALGHFQHGAFLL